MNPLIGLLVTSSIVLVGSLLSTVVQLLPMIFSILSIVVVVIVKYLKAKKPEPLTKKLFVLPHFKKVRASHTP